MAQPKAAAPTVTLEVSPRVTKVLVATRGPLRIQRVQASTTAEGTEDTLSALRALLEAQPLGARHIGLLFGREAFSLRTLELPSIDPKEISSMLELQLGKLTPYPRHEILSAWTVIGSFRAGYTSILLAIARKTLIDGVLQLLKTKGVAPQWVGVSTEGIERWWAAHGAAGAKVAQDQLLAVIDVDFASTDCVILGADGHLLFTHSVALGFEQLQAEPARLRWVAELVRLPRILQHEELKGKIGRGVVTGVTEGLEPLIDQLNSQWGVPIEVMDALKPAAPPEPVRQKATASHVSYTALLGMVGAEKPPRIDLIPQEARVSQTLSVRSKHLARLTMSLALMLLLVGVVIGERIVMRRQYLSRLQQRLAAIEPSAREVLQRQERMQRIRTWLNPSRGPLEVFHAVASSATAPIAITHVLIVDGKPVKIRGRAQTVAEVLEFAERLRQSGVFAGVDARPLLRSTAETGQIAEFEIFCEIGGAS
ncbi:MAG: hypothetical protein COV75_08935 [Candidatus Omnitrophica bacterium CG11_big_fil_rev_8_21_14_0_20_63_9]|nr:MAG: hypothetical protein COV75_08935 [Candidatus Omnitrophica bacterium CG11_big_fil_rev_8_21_14_0_20_63_9]